MKPNFALDLTFDGLALLHRAGEAGWHVVGEVPLDSPSLSGDLAALRKKANTLDPAGMRTKLIIPDQQIRYLDIPAASAPHGDYDAAAADALDGATPYALHDLAYDWTVSGERLHVAAVARETLDEADGFAREHKFNPVCFVADPDQELFPGEPFFGVTGDADASGPTERDTGPLKRLGALPEAEADEKATDAPADGAGGLSFASVRAERSLPPTPAPRLEGAARITPGPLPDADARAISGAAQASLAPRDAAPPPAPEAAKTVTRPTAGPPKTSPAMPRADPPEGDEAPTAAPAARVGAPAADAARPPPSDEAERLTIFGARSQRDGQRGKPRFLGLILTAALLLALIGVAAWAALFPETGLGRLLRGTEPQIAVTPDIPELQSPDTQPQADPVERTAPDSRPDATDAPPAIAEPEIAALPGSRDQAPVPREDRTAGDSEPENATSGWTAPRTPDEARQRYAATGIWPSAPTPPEEPGAGNLDTFYQTSIDTDVTFEDAVALPRAASLAPDQAPARPALPPPPGRTFELDERGFVRATPEGTLTPEGVRVRSGPPPVRPPDTPPRAVPLSGLIPTEAAREARETLSGIRPRLRPETLIERHERGALGGRSRTELAALRPRDRPASIPARAEASAEASEESLAESLKPRLRPVELARAATSSPEPTRAAPAIPTSASVARSATERNAINLRQVNLIGVYGSPANRRALVRLSNGGYRKVQVGDRIDGGRVSAIGDAELRYTKGGRNVVLRIPRG